MSQTKSKKKTDLDKELDEYMKVARSQSFAGKIGLVGLTPTTPPLDTDSDGPMEIVEWSLGAFAIVYFLWITDWLRYVHLISASL